MENSTEKGYMFGATEVSTKAILLMGLSMEKGFGGNN
jgi:hypothetical protein